MSTVVIPARYLNEYRELSGKMAQATTPLQIAQIVARRAEIETLGEKAKQLTQKKK